jgi:hydroxymethylbilane synthase
MSLHLRIATRGSKLALWQTAYIGEQLKALGIASEKVVIKTEGDRIQDRFLNEIGGKGLFIKELEQAMLQGRADIAMHSLKDLPARLEQEFVLPAVLKRHSVRDAFIASPKLALPPLGDEAWLSSLPEMVIGTGSLRRSALLAKANPKLKTVPIRGNVDTRIKKLEEGQWDGIILAEASLIRLGIKTHYCPLDPHWFTPSSSQGALAIESLASSPHLNRIKDLQCEETRKCVDIERGVLGRLGGDCTMPFGCWAFFEDQEINVHAQVLGTSGHAAEARMTFALSDSVPQIINKIFAELLGNGAHEILKSLGITLETNV